MSKKIKIGVLGSANIAERMVLPAILELDTFQLVGVASRSNIKAKIIAEKFGTKAYTGYETINDASPDAIYIPLPNSLHYYWIKYFLNLGVHVLVEKSMTCDLIDTTELNELARSKGLALLENFQFRFHNQLSFIKQLLKNDVIGELRNIRSAFGFPPFVSKDNIRYFKELGGGALLDAGAYPIKISQIFMNDDIFVDSSSLNVSDEFGVDTWGSAFLKSYTNNVTSQIAFGFDQYYQNTLELWGSRGKITANRIFTAGPGIAPEVLVETDFEKKKHIIQPENHFVKMLEYFQALIQGKIEKELEFSGNIKQARLLHELLSRA